MISILEDFNLSLKKLISILESEGPKDNYIRIEMQKFWTQNDLLLWLSEQPTHPRLFFSNKDKTFSIAGILPLNIIKGETDSFQGSFTNILSSNYFYIGGHCFKIDNVNYESKKGDNRWSKWDDFLFVAPKIAIISKKNKTSLIIQKIHNHDEILMNYISKSLKNTSFDRSLFKEISITETKSNQINFDIWHAQAKNAIDKLNPQISKLNTNADDINKIVLSRLTEIRLKQTIDPFILLNKLQNYLIKSHSFLIDLDGKDFFIGCSPENLLTAIPKNSKTLNNWIIKTEALAGTMPINKHNKTSMLHDKKLELEHSLVIDDIRGILRQFCIDIREDRLPKEIKLPHLRHLYYAFSAKINNFNELIKLPKLIHPTAAVSGSPKINAIREISNIELHDRGWYSGFVGYAGKNKFSFAVSIRSALIQPKKLSIYAGVGLVNSSNPKDEWDELNIKIEPFYKALGLKNYL